jgi:hypothetical protein
VLPETFLASTLRTETQRQNRSNWHWPIAMIILGMSQISS